MRETLATALKTAQKTQDKRRVSTLRLIQAAIQDRDIINRGSGKDPVSDDEILQILQKMVKQRQESIAIYDANGRPELAEGERAEITVINDYLPKQMEEAEVKAAIEEVIAEIGASSVKDMGKVIGVLRGAYAGQMDFGKVSPMVKAALGG